MPETGSYVAGAAASPMCSLCEGAPSSPSCFTARQPLQQVLVQLPVGVAGLVVRPLPVVLLIDEVEKVAQKVRLVVGARGPRDHIGVPPLRGHDGGEAVPQPKEGRGPAGPGVQNLLERLSRLGIDAEGKLEKEPHGPRDFVKMFKDVDAAVDAEVVQFMNSMAKNNITYKDLVKSCYHVMQYSCNPFAQPACPVFTQLFYRSLLTILQDISLPICMCYENDNPGLGQSPPEWLKGHYQTLCTNFRSLAIDKGVLTAKEAKVVHGEPTCDLPDLDAALQGRVYGRRLPVRMSKVLMLCPRNIKIKNRVVFTGENAALQNSFNL